MHQRSERIKLSGQGDPGFSFGDGVSAEDWVAEQNRGARSDAIEEVGRGLGDWVETWAKPIGCWLDRVTGRMPGWLIAERPFKGLRLARPETRSERRLRMFMARVPGLPLAARWRTEFCGATPSCGCAARKAKLNTWLPDAASATAWRAACNALATALISRFKNPCKTP